MKKNLIALPLVALGLAAAPAMAQDANQADVYAGVQAGYHDLGDNPVGDEGGAIYGLYAGVDYPVGEALILGLEGNYNQGSDAIDEEYGIAAKLGYRVGSGGQVFVRGGYQEVNVNLPAASGGVIGDDDFDDTDGDYLVGAGAQFRLNENFSLRGVVDTIAFDSVRGTVGVAFHF